MQKEKRFAIVWEAWGIGGWCFYSMEEAIKNAMENCKIIRCKEIIIAEKITDSKYKIVYKDKFVQNKINP